MELWHQYHTPRTVDEALALLRAHGGRARIIAGGTDLLTEGKAEGHPPHEALVDITGIPELNALERSGDHIVIGAAVTHARIVKSALIRTRATCLAESCGVVGGPQVRNVATLGGNVAHALPAGDGTVSLVALDAEAEVMLDGVQRWLPIRDLFLGPARSLLDPTRDLLLRFRIRAAADGQASAFNRVMRPQGVALPVLGCAVWIALDTSQTHYADARVCIAPVGPTPTRAEAVEAALIGQPATPETLEAAVAAGQASLHPRTSKYRATAEYRHELIAVLLRRTLTAALDRARAPIPVSA
ncbi:MAG: FAD binding domain-containing protein [Anaerolinea sp.]|nr:FAD binding domain-containing protein [Anaerolinea sp.]